MAAKLRAGVALRPMVETYCRNTPACIENPAASATSLGNHCKLDPMTDWTPTRAEGERVLAAFSLRMGRRHANGRNTDHGPSAQKAVSVLSPDIRRRLVLEQVAVAAALAAHGPEDAEKFATFTARRFTPRPSDLAEVTQGLEATGPDGLPPVLPLRALIAPNPSRPTALLVTDEDCRAEDFDLAALDIRTVATLSASHLRSPLPVSGLVQGFEAGALTDAALRSGVTATARRADDPGSLAKWAASAGAAQIATPYITHGLRRDWLDDAAPVLAKAGITLCKWRRDWDTAIWPHATTGFFKVKQNIPRILQQTLPT